MHCIQEGIIGWAEMVMNAGHSKEILREAYAGYREVVQLLLENGADIDSKGNAMEWIALR